ncbi:unnamed protein product [Linum trigynum]|uniref:Uncharacterized protein n=1 Tax=Linum trigynum TaxID=586398 RepID=A0AAV2GPK6_9ROSI
MIGVTAAQRFSTKGWSNRCPRKRLRNNLSAENGFGGGAESPNWKSEISLRREEKTASEEEENRRIGDQR